MYGHFKNSLHAYPVVGMELQKSEDGTKPKEKGIWWQLQVGHS